MAILHFNLTALPNTPLPSLLSIFPNHLSLLTHNTTCTSLMPHLITSSLNALHHVTISMYILKSHPTHTPSYLFTPSHTLTQHHLTLTGGYGVFIGPLPEWGHMLRSAECLSLCLFAGLYWRQLRTEHQWLLQCHLSWELFLWGWCEWICVSLQPRVLR